MSKENPEPNGINSKEVSSDDIQQAELKARLQRIQMETDLQKARLQRTQMETDLQQARQKAELQRMRQKKLPLAAIIGLLLLGTFVGYIFLNAYITVQRNRALGDELATQINSLESALAQPSASQTQDTQMQSLVREVEYLRTKLDSELEASKESIKATREANDRIFLLFVLLSGVGSFFGIATWYSARQEQQEEKGRDRAMFALQEKNLEEINTITTAIAAGAKENVDSLNTILATFQQIMDFKVSEAVRTQETLAKMQLQLQELEEAQRQQVEELRSSAERLRRPRHIYTSPDPDVQRQMREFRTQMDSISRVMLERYTGVASPADNRRYGEIYLRRGVIAYLDNDMLKSREMLKIAEQFFPVPEQGTSGMPRDQKLPIAFTQFYLALIEKNYGEMAAAKDHIEKSYAVYGQNEPGELLTPVTRAEILSYLGDMGVARSAIQEVLDRTDTLRQRGSLEPHDATYALRARLLLGNTYYVKAEWEKALQHYQEILEEGRSGSFSYYAYHSIAQVHHQLGEEEKAQKNKRLAYQALLETEHLRTKVALDTQILLNALAYRCTYKDKPEKAKEYRHDFQELWLRIHPVNGLALRLFSLEKKRPISKDEFWTEVLAVND